MFLRFPWMTKFILFNRSYVQLGTKILRHLKQMFPSKFHIKEILQNLQKNQHIDDWSIIGRATKVVKFICSYDFHYVVNKAWVIVHILFVVVISSRTLHHLLFCFTVGTGKREEVCKYVSLYISALFVCILSLDSISINLRMIRLKTEKVSAKQKISRGNDRTELISLIEKMMIKYNWRKTAPSTFGFLTHSLPIRIHNHHVTASVIILQYYLSSIDRICN
jgi:hypothetical protein